MKKILVIFFFISGFIFYSEEYKNNMKGIQMYNRKKYNESLKYFEKAYLNNPDNNVNIYNKAVVLFKTHNLAESKNLFKILLNKNFKKEVVYYYLGEICFQENNLKQSKLNYIKSLKYNPKFNIAKIKLQLVNQLINSMENKTESDTFIYKDNTNNENNNTTDINKISDDNTENFLKQIIETNAKLLKKNKKNSSYKNILW